MIAVLLPDVHSISTHSLTRRLTPCQFFRRCGRNYFNSQPHKEADTHQSRGTDGH